MVTLSENAEKQLVELMDATRDRIDRRFKNLSQNSINDLYAASLLHNMNKLPGVYFIYNLDTGLTKIGCSGDLQKRFSQLNSAAKMFGQRIDIIGFICTFFGGQRKLESYLHNKFASKRQYSEWFDLDMSDFDDCVAGQQCINGIRFDLSFDEYEYCMPAAKGEIPYKAAYSDKFLNQLAKETHEYSLKNEDSSFSVSEIESAFRKVIYKMENLSYCDIFSTFSHNSYDKEFEFWKWTESIDCNWLLKNDLYYVMLDTLIRLYSHMCLGVLVKLPMKCDLYLAK